MRQDNELIAASATSKEVEYVEKSGKKKKMEIKDNRKSGDWGPSYEKYKAEVNKEANSRVTKPISHEIFKKTEDEREMLKAMKTIHKAALKAQGLDPKKVMNPHGVLFND